MAGQAGRLGPRQASVIIGSGRSLRWPGLARPGQGWAEGFRVDLLPGGLVLIAAKGDTALMAG